MCVFKLLFDISDHKHSVQSQSVVALYLVIAVMAITMIMNVTLQCLCEKALSTLQCEEKSNEYINELFISKRLQTAGNAFFLFLLWDCYNLHSCTSHSISAFMILSLPVDHVPSCTASQK